MPRDLASRTFIKGAGATGAAALAPGTASAINDSLDADGGVQEIIVVFDDDADTDVLDRFDLPEGHHSFEVLLFAYARATGEQIREITAEVRSYDPVCTEEE